MGFKTVVTAGRLRTLSLICGIFSSLLWVGIDILAGTLWEGYNFIDQAVSELSAIGAPTRPLVASFLLVYEVLMFAFGLGVWAYGRERFLRLIGCLMVGVGVVGFVGIPFPLQLGVAEATFTNIMHSILAGTSGILFLLAMGLGAFVCGRRFRLFSIGALLTLIVIGALSGFMAGVDITQHGFTAPPHWFGLIERVDIYGSMLWVVVLAIVLLRAEKGPGLVSARDT